MTTNRLLPAPIAVRGGRRTPYEVREALVRRVCRAVANGVTLEAACRDPMAPLRQTFQEWVGQDEGFAAMLAQARAAGEQARARRAARPGAYSAELAAAFCARIEAGRGLLEVCSEPDMPSHTTVYRWVKTRPKFAEAYSAARKVQADLLFDLAWTLARRAGEHGGDVRAARLLIETIRWRCGKLSPRAYGTPHR
jgi:hypothetical protein